jgi:inosine/xanthosine triphosphatase
METIHICVGSTNPVKIDSVRLAFQQIFPLRELNVFGVNALSEVPEQPFGDDMTIQGAKNRAKNAFDISLQKNEVIPNYSVGLEGSNFRIYYLILIILSGGVVEKDNNKLECFAWGAIYDGNTFGTARSASVNLPYAISKLVSEGLELGHADDAVFGTVNSKQKEGTIGHLTKGVMTRTQYYIPIVILAFVPFNWPELYSI